MSVRSSSIVLGLLLSSSTPCTGERRDRRLIDLTLGRRLGSSHVTRLHRYDHSGLASMIEMEARWHANSSLFEPAGPFMQVSNAQLEWLQEHNRRALDQSEDLRDVKSHSGASKEDLRSSLHAAHAAHAAVHASQAKIDGYRVTVLTNLDSQYVGPLGIGTVAVPQGCSAEGGSLAYLSPGAQSLSEARTCHAEDEVVLPVVFDTGSTNLWLNSDLCTKGSCGMSERKKYNHARSQSFAEAEQPMDLKVQFGTGALSGRNAVDDLRVGDITIYKQNFDMIERTEGAVFNEIAMDGICGLAMPNMAAAGSVPFFDNLIQDKTLKHNLFAFYFGPNKAANAIFWGSYDSSFIEKGEKVKHFPVKNAYYWSVNLHSFQIDGEEYFGDGTATAPKTANSLLQQETPLAIVDTGTTFFTAPKDLYSAIEARLPSVACDDITKSSHPDISFQLEDIDGERVDYTLTNVQYMAQAGTQCEPAFMQIDIPTGPGMILGEVFIRNYLAIFDRRSGRLDDARIGFAKSVHGEPVENRLRELTHKQQSMAQHFQK